MKLSYAICTHNEEESLLDLLNRIHLNKEEQDEVVILDDYSTSKITTDILSTQPNVHRNKLNKDYAKHMEIDLPQEEICRPSGDEDVLKILIQNTVDYFAKARV